MDNNKAMEEFEKALLKAFDCAIKKPEDVKVKDNAMKLASTNKTLFDAHIKEGFTAEQAIQIVIAINGCNA